MNEIHSRVGETFINRQGCKFEITEYFNALNCTIKFFDKVGTILYNNRYGHVKVGNVKNPNLPRVFGVGYIGTGKYITRINKKRTHFYTLWKAMLARCYDEKHLVKRPSYRDIGVCIEWHNFQNFAKWYEENYNPETMQGWDLDKDLICYDCKEYSPENCVFLPSEINMLFTKKRASKEYPMGVSNVKGRYRASIYRYGATKVLGFFNTPEEAFKVYKETKEKHIKEVADLWKDKISDRIYQAMYNFEINITD